MVDSLCRPPSQNSPSLLTQPMESSSYRTQSAVEQISIPVRYSVRHKKLSSRLGRTPAQSARPTPIPVETLRCRVRRRVWAQPPRRWWHSWSRRQRACPYLSGSLRIQVFRCTDHRPSRNQISHREAVNSFPERKSNPLQMLEIYRPGIDYRAQILLGSWISQTARSLPSEAISSQYVRDMSSRREFDMSSVLCRADPLPLKRVQPYEVAIRSFL